MPPKPAPAVPTNPPKGQKRKKAPQSSSFNTDPINARKGPKRVKIYDARTILSQNKDAAVKNGELDLQAFLNAREFEIKALEDGMQRSKSNLMERAFQSVPRDMRRRTASHNVKRVPKRLQKRAAREMKGDNTPTVNQSKRKPKTSRGRLRAETAKRLGILAAKKRAQKLKDGEPSKDLETRAARPKIRKDKPNDPPKPASKFRKRQLHKTWLPTHMWHAKRARMTEPKNPLWRFALPTTSTEKSYRPTHRASGIRGAIAWDMSYMSTIALEGPVESIEKLLKSVGVTETHLLEQKGKKWREGKRSWNGWLTREVENQQLQIGPSTVIWCSSESNPPNDAIVSKKRTFRRAFVRIHPSSFLETWTELLRLSKLLRPKIHLEDLRFEIGSINITGPGSTETLLGILHPFHESGDASEKHAEAFKALAGVSNPGSLPANAVLAFSIMDPRLRYPSRRIALPKSDDEEANLALLEMLSSWPVDTSYPSAALFDRDARFKATRLPAQKSINRRKGASLPGAHPALVPTDPPIPIILVASRTARSTSAQGTWTLLAPWKCILPVWYGLVHHPLVSGGNPRFGGLDELRQVHFERGVPWFPADYPGTDAGFAWEVEKREERKAQWDRKPKGKRIEWGSLDLGGGRKGEIGRGWACDFERLVGINPLPDRFEYMDTTEATQDTTEKTTQDAANKATTKSSVSKVEKSAIKSPVQQITKNAFTALLSAQSPTPPPPTHMATIRLTLTTRGIAFPCARIYRLPSTSSQINASTVPTPALTTRESWLTLLPAPTTGKPRPNPKSAKNSCLGKIPVNIPVSQRTRLLAQSFLQDPPMSYPATKDEDDHPLIPNEEDLIGFVTTGEFNLAEGKGVAIGSVSVARILDGKGKKAERRLCIVRNAGEKIGRLARWEAV